MNPRTRAAFSVALLGCALLVVRLDETPLAGSILLAAGVRAALDRSLGRTLRSSLPILLFAAVLLVLQWFGGGIDLTVPARTVAVFLFSTAAFRAAPWEALAAHLSPRSRFYAVGLFLLLVRHFSVILMEESRRTFQARSLIVGNAWRRGGFASLTWAVAAVFRRALARAERFYAAQSVGGLVS